jgi:hypothetical protein
MTEIINVLCTYQSIYDFGLAFLFSVLPHILKVIDICTSLFFISKSVAIVRPMHTILTIKYVISSAIISSKLEPSCAQHPCIVQNSVLHKTLV